MRALANKATVTLALFLGLLCAASRGTASPFSFSYGGRLADSNDKGIAGPVDLEVKFYTVASGGSPIGVSPQLFPGVSLNDGVFQVDLTLLPQELAVVFPAGGDTYVEVTDHTHNVTYPRQHMTAIPYALRVPVDGKTINYDSSGNLTAVAGSTPGAVVQVQSGGKLPALDGSQLTNVSAGSISGLGPLATLSESGNPSTVLRGDGTWGPVGAFSSYMGNVGIATSTPAAALDVEGTLKIGAGTPGFGKVLMSDASGFATWQTVSGSSPWTAAGSNIWYGTGNVGIGSTAPGNALVVVGTTSPTRITVQDNGGPNVGSIEASQNNLQLCWLSHTCPLTVAYASGGKVGIDDTTPTNALDVTGSVAIGFTSPMPAAPSNGLLVSGKVGIGSSAPVAQLDIVGAIKIVDGNQGTSKVLTSDINGLASWQNPAALPVTNYGSQVLTNVTSLSIGTTSTGADLLFASGSNRTLAIGSQSSAGNNLTIQAGGTTTTSTNGGNLILASGSTITGAGSSQIQLRTSNSGTTINALTILGNGNVGIGTTAPSAALHVNGANSSGMGGGEMELTSNSSFGPIMMLNASSYSGHTFSLKSTAAGDGLGVGKLLIGDATEDSWRMGIDTAGNVGIGTISPVGALDVEGGNPVILNAGYVGIGTTAPQYPLDVRGANATMNLYSTTPADPAFTKYGNGTYAFDIGIEGSAPGVIVANDTPNAGVIAAYSLPIEFSTDGSSVAMTISTAGHVGIGSNAPGQALSVAGIIESTGGGFKFPDGTVQTTSAKTVGAGTTGPVVGTAYQASTPLFVSAWGTDPSGTCDLQAFSDVNAAPTTNVASASTGGVNLKAQVFFPVPANAYYEIVSACATVNIYTWAIQ